MNDQLHRHGYVRIAGALDPELTDRLGRALDAVYREECAGGRLAPGERMHLLGQLGRDNAFLELLDHPSVFPAIWAELGWNIHMYHCHLDVTPPLAASAPRSGWAWHQDGGRQNLELDGSPRPRLSLKVAYWLSDLSEPERGNLLVIPGSHVRNGLARPTPDAVDHDPPAGAIPILAVPGDALIFDRRLWHSRSDNRSTITRRAVFLAYTYRWIRPRDRLDIGPHDPRFAGLAPVRQQLLGATAEPHSHWGLQHADVPLHGALAAQGRLDAAVPWLR